MAVTSPVPAASELMCMKGISFRVRVPQGLGPGQVLASWKMGQQPRAAPKTSSQQTDKPQINAKPCLTLLLTAKPSLVWPWLSWWPALAQTTWISLTPLLCLMQLLAFAEGGSRPLLDPANSRSEPTWTAGSQLQKKALMQRWRMGLVCLCMMEQKYSPTADLFKCEF